MYVPKHFTEDRLDVLHATIGRTGLATLVTLGADGLIAIAGLEATRRPAEQAVAEVMRSPRPGQQSG